MIVTISKSSGYSLQRSTQSLCEDYYPPLFHTGIARAYLRQTQESIEDIQEQRKHGYHVEYYPNLGNIRLISKRAKEQVYRLSWGQQPIFNWTNNGTLHNYNYDKSTVQQDKNGGSN